MFKMASIMASRGKICFVMPVLANIYHGLNKIGESAEPYREHVSFSLHFLTSWIAHYFKTRFSVWEDTPRPKMVLYLSEGCAQYNTVDARRKLFCGEKIMWSALYPRNAMSTFVMRMT